VLHYIQHTCAETGFRTIFIEGMIVSYKVFTDSQVQQFIDRGYVTLPGAFPRENALAAQSFLWSRLKERDGIDRNDPTTWTTPMVRLNETYNTDVFQRCDVPLLGDAIEDLVGKGRWRERGSMTNWGWWPVNFAEGADRPWTVPSTGWHWDGIHFKHTVDAPDQGLLMLCLFSEIGPHGGGTVVAEGSHQVVARFLARQTEGRVLREAIDECRREHPWLAELTGAAPSTDDPRARNARFMDEEYIDDHGTRLRVVETTGGPGDVIFCHPFLFHAASQNHSGVTRFMCNRTTPLYERMSFDREDGDYSPVEQSIRCALK